MENQIGLKTTNKFIIIGIFASFLGVLLVIFILNMLTKKGALENYQPTPVQENITPADEGITPVKASPTPYQGSFTEEDARIQSESDKDYADWEKNISDKYPWFDKLPLQETNYFVYFDVDKKSFIGKLYPKDSQAESVDEKITVMKNEIQTRLEALGIDTALYNFEWIVKSEL